APRREIVAQPGDPRATLADEAVPEPRDHHPGDTEHVPVLDQHAVSYDRRPRLGPRAGRDPRGRAPGSGTGRAPASRTAPLSAGGRARPLPGRRSRYRGARAVPEPPRRYRHAGAVTECARAVPERPKPFPSMPE